MTPVTRVVCNPRGTGDDSIGEFDAGFTLALEGSTFQ